MSEATRLVTMVPPSLKAAVSRASRRATLTPSAFVRLAIMERLAREPQPAPRPRKRDAVTTATPPPSVERQAAVA
jgi:hypothetical protein